MDNIIFIAGALGIGYLAFSKNEKPPVEKKKRVEAAKPTIESTKIGLLPREDKKALLMNLKNVKPYNKALVFIPAVVGGISTVFYITRRMFAVLNTYYNAGYKDTSFALRESIAEIFPPGASEYMVKKIDRSYFKYDIRKAEHSNPDTEEDTQEKRRRLKEELEKLEEQEELEKQSYEPPQLPVYGKGVTFIKPESENILIENKEPSETMQNAQINKIDNIPVIVKKEKKEATEFDKPLIEQDIKFYKYDEKKEGEITTEDIKPVIVKKQFNRFFSLSLRKTILKELDILNSYGFILVHKNFLSLYTQLHASMVKIYEQLNSYGTITLEEFRDLLSKLIDIYKKVHQYSLMCINTYFDYTLYPINIKSNQQLLDFLGEGIKKLEAIEKEL